MTRAPSDMNAGHDTIKVIDQKAHVGSVSWRVCASRTHRDANIRRSESRRVIDAVSDHHDRTILSFRKDDQHFLIGCQLRSHGVNPEASRYGFSHPAAVSGGENDA